MFSKKTLLVVEDNIINRSILCNILEDEYSIIEAENGAVALDLLEKNSEIIAAMIVDIVMPVMDGYEMLSRVKQNSDYNNIPIIVASGQNDEQSEIKALELGAWDFITKPYNADIIEFRLKNAIERSKLNLFEQLQYHAEHDMLTGLYNSRMFFQYSDSIISQNPTKEFAILRFDIERFKQINNLYGTDRGDEFIKYISRIPIFAEKEDECVFAHMNADVFAVCIQYKKRQDVIDKIEAAQKYIADFSDEIQIFSVFGVFYVDHHELTVGEMLDRATMAANSRKGKYSDGIAFFTEQMELRQENEERIISTMHKALEEEQFCVFFQPKYNIATESLCGAEALVRWNNPKKGLVSPGEFIPVFEKTGFIAKVDYYVWKKTCEYLKKWSDAGLNPSPVSVNISRINLLNPKLVDIFTDLVNEYGIEPRLLRLEITETAYMDNPETMNGIVTKLHERGFVVLMDDFGSGYSSLNTLKEIFFDILKIDMKFLPSGEKDSRSEKILASIIRMADWIGMPVIVEGVETTEQRDFLKSVGCTYIQGYLYGRPMPAEEYELLISDSHLNLDVTISSISDTNNLDDLLSSDRNIETILSGISIPVAIYDYSDMAYDRLRANQSFYETFGYRTNDIARSRFFDSENKKLASAFSAAVESKGSSSCEVFCMALGGVTKWYRVNVRFISANRNGNIVCAVYTEISEAKQVESEMNKIVGVLNKRNNEEIKTMLIVDDQEMNIDILSSIFKDKFSVISANNGEDALKILENDYKEISVILLDLIMPKMDGKEFLARKNAIRETADIPVVVISSDKREDVQLDMLRSGVNDYITKPFIPELVYRRVLNVLEFQSRFSELVNEYRKTIAMSPLMGTYLEKSYLSINDLKALLVFLEPIFDIVRLVDPEDTAVISISDDDKLCKAPYTCFKVWNKQSRCANCTSLCAAKQGCQMTKYEFIENDIFYVISKPVEIILDDGSYVRIILEIVSHVSDALLAQNYNGHSMKEWLENTEDKIYRDPLTGAYNRRYMYEMKFLQNVVGKPLKSVAVMIIDIKDFKDINDGWGHSEGDRVLVEIVEILNKSILSTDCVIRYGGDEFIVLFTDTSIVSVMKKINELKLKLSYIRYGDNKEISIKANFGMSYTEAFEGNKEFLNKMIDEADMDLYRKVNEV